MLAKLLGLLIGLMLTSGAALAQDVSEDDLCVDYFGIGLLKDETCRPLARMPSNVGPSDLPSVLSDAPAALRIVSEKTPEEPFDLSPLATAPSVLSLDLFRVGPLDLSPIERMDNLLSLSLSADAVDALDQVSAQMPNLRELRLFGPRRVIDLSALARFPSLRVLYVKADAITGQDSLRTLPNLERITFELAQETDFSALSALENLTWLEVSGTLGRPVVSDIGFVAPLTSLTHLDLSSNSIEDLTPLSGLENLRLLVLSDNTTLSDITPLSALTGLKVLQLRETQVSDLDPLRPMTELGILWLDRTPVADIDPLRDLTQLSGLELSRTQVTDISALRDLPLRHLSLRGTNVTDISAVPEGTRLKK